MGSQSILTGLPQRRDTETEIHKETGVGGTHLMAKDLGKHQKLKEVKKGSPYTGFTVSVALPTLNFGLLQGWETIHFCCLKTQGLL